MALVTADVTSASRDAGIATRAPTAVVLPIFTSVSQLRSFAGTASLLKPRKLQFNLVSSPATTTQAVSLSMLSAQPPRMPASRVLPTSSVLRLVKWMSRSLQPLY